MIVDHIKYIVRIPSQFPIFYRELLSGTVARLGSDAESLCPELSDREDEEEIQRLFCFILADQSPEGNLLRRDTLQTEDFVLPLFCDPGHILLLHTQSQPHHDPGHILLLHTQSQPHYDGERAATGGHGSTNIDCATITTDSHGYENMSTDVSITSINNSIAMETALNTPPTSNPDHMVDRSVTSTDSAPSLPGWSLGSADLADGSSICHSAESQGERAEPCEYIYMGVEFYCMLCI